MEKLRARIDVHGPVLRQSEALTRYTLIDPLLRELGWDTENPTLVIPEYQTDDGRPDYALFSDGKPIMMVEAKKLGTALQGKVIRQGVGYCLEQGTLYFSVTDGRLWKIYETHRSVPIDEKRVVEFDLKSQSAAEACLKALTLWGLRVSGHVTTGQTPVVGSTRNLPDSREPRTPTPQPTSPSLNEHEGQPLSQLNPQLGSHPPVEIQFPDGSIVSVNRWKGLLVGVVKWLEENRLLTTNHCPIRMMPKSKRYAVSIDPVHSDGKQFRAPARAGSLHVETHESSKVIAQVTRTTIEHVGQDPAQFKAWFS